MSQFQTCSVQQLASDLQSDPAATLVDVRTPLEFQEVHVPEAENVPLDRLAANAVSAEDQTLYVICKSGGRASQACHQLAKVGGGKIVLVEGGTDAWVAAGLPVVRGKKAISLERQVRIVAGTLVIAGVIAGLAWHPLGYGLSAFVGAGLVFAGVTDTCGMGMLLAKMPWNNVSDKSKTEVANQEGEKCATKT